MSMRLGWYRVLGTRWIGRNLGLIIPPEADLSPLTDRAGSLLGFYQLEALSDSFGAKWDIPPRAVMHLIVRIWAWPSLWLLLLVVKYLGGSQITSLSVAVESATDTRTYRVGHPDPTNANVTVVRIERGVSSYLIYYGGGDYLTLGFQHVDHNSIQRGEQGEVVGE
jgi:hypothetical protein